MSFTHVDNTENNTDKIDIFRSDIDLYTKLYCEENNIDDLCNVTQNRYTGLLRYLNRMVIKNINLRQDFIYKSGISVIHNKDMFTNNNEYNLELIYDLLNVYLDMSDKYDKISNVNGFSIFTGIDLEMFYQWNNGSRLSPLAQKIFKKLNTERERSLSDRLVSGRVNPVGVLGALNHWHGWSGVGNMQEDKTKQAATLDDIRKNTALLSDNSNADVAQTAENSNLKLSDNLTQLESQ